MKKQPYLKHLLFAVTLCLVTLTSIQSHAKGIQPYEKSSQWVWNLPIDGYGWCGPTALYHVINYYGDFGSYHYRVKTLFRTYWGQGTLELPEISMGNLMLISETAFGLFIQPSQRGAGWSLLDNIGDLYYTKDLNDNLYNVYVCSKFTKTGETEVRRKRLEYILENLLEKDIPVILHLHSGYYGMGHYITLVGYDEKRGEIYYVDSLQNEEGLLVVSVDDFLGSRFYKRGLLYSARWDGEWMAFWHREYGTLCDQCGE